MDIFYTPQFRAFDNAGAPAAGALLNFYKFGTTTRQDTYSDVDRLVPHTNPVVADSNGFFPAIYFGTAFDYYVTCTNSGATETYFTIDSLAKYGIDGSTITAGTITTAAYADNSVTLAKQAHGTQGSIPIYGASGAPTELTYGTDGYVLKAKGSGANVAFEAPALPTGYKTGLTLSLDTDADHDILVAAGSARDSTDTVNIVGSSLTKQIDATWVAGNNAGGMFTGTVAVGTTYYFFAIVKDSDSSVDYGFDTSSSCANIPTGYTKYLLLDTLLTDSSANLINSMNGRFDSGQQTITAAGAITLSHGLGAQPFNINLWLHCTAAENGFSIGDEIAFNYGYRSDVVSGSMAVVATSSAINVRVGNSNPLYYIHNTTGAIANLTASNWTLIVRAEV